MNSLTAADAHGARMSSARIFQARHPLPLVARPFRYFDEKVVVLSSRASGRLLRYWRMGITSAAVIASIYHRRYDGLDDSAATCADQRFLALENLSLRVGFRRTLAAFTVISAMHRLLA